MDMNRFYKTALTICLLIASLQYVNATGEPSTYFNIFVPPNNDPVQRNVCLVITAIFDETTFSIQDDGMDGDTDDTVEGLLMAGQSYILYIKDNGINDDAQYASGGVLKRDGDYFIVHSNKNVYASQSTNSDWQHDWVPGISQSSLSQKFILYSTKTTSSKRDVNAFAYEDSTIVTMKRISNSATLATGYTDVDYQGGTVMFQRMIHRGQDLIHFYQDARNIMDDGHSYVVESSKPITLQYGALYGNERDGGGYVPTSSGSSSGSLAYFTVPYQSVGEQEIRVVSWDAGNNVKLYRFNAGAWVLMKDWTMQARTVQEWVGKTNGNVSYPTVFKIECTAGKRVSIFEGNWFETGSPGTSDMATMMSAENGTTAGNYFIAYMAPPGKENTVVNPATGAFYGGNYTHLYIFSQDTAHVQIKDSYTGGVDFSLSYTILPNGYLDCALSETQWKNIYNGTGTVAGGPERPYLTVTSDAPVSVMNTNFNDNWMMYFGSSQFRSLGQTSTSSSSVISPEQTLTVESKVTVIGADAITDVTASVNVEGGLDIVTSTFVDNTNGGNYSGTITINEAIVTSTFTNLPDLYAGGDYKIVTVLQGNVMDAAGIPIPNNSISDVTTIVNGQSDGKQMQSTSIESVALNSYNTTQLIFDFAENTQLENVLTDSWTTSLIDFDQDGDDDLFFTDRNPTQPNKLLRNNGNNTFTAITAGNIVTDLAQSMSSSWADFDGDNDLDVVVANNTQKPCFFYVNNGNGTFTKNSSAEFTQHPGYYHHVSWCDVNNDGELELYLGNYWPTRFNELWGRDANGNWRLWEENLLSQINGTGTGATWADYDNDGYQDLLLLNNELGTNRMYHNLGNGQFEEVHNMVTDAGGRSVGSVWGDIDNDNDLDLFISNASNEDNDLFLNNGGGVFAKVTSGDVVSNGGHSHGCAFVDVDKDMDMDLYVANDQGVKFLYLNDGTGNFTRKSDEWPTSNFGKSYGVAFGDIDLDGDCDLVNATHSNQRNYLFTANNNANKWLGIRLAGTNSNHSAIGARVKVKAGGKWQIREVNSQSGFGGQSSYRQHFGLGNVALVDSIVVTWPSGYVQKMANVNPNQNLVITEENGSIISGVLYYDANGDCQKNANETVLKQVAVTIQPLGVVCYSDENGVFSIHLSPGNYMLQFDATNFSSTCTQASNFSVAGIGNSMNVGSFALTPNCLNANLNITPSCTILRRGFANEYHIEVNNLGVAKADNVVVTATLPLTLEPVSASPMWSTNTAGNASREITWVIDAMDYGATQMLLLQFNVPLSLMPDDVVTANFSLTSSTSDCDNKNNSFADSQKIFGSVDPNDLLAFPNGTGNQHLVERDQDLTYRIRFQNVGNYLAETVRVVDVLPMGLDVNSIHHISASHDYRLIQDGRKLEFVFENIQLPDSASDMLQSNGFIQFSITQDKELKNGDVLNNIALIQFDYNEYIATNKVFHTVTTEDDVDSPGVLQLFPNPAKQVCYAYAKALGKVNPDLMDITVTSMDGNRVMNMKGGNSLTSIHVADLIPGVYVVSAKDINGKFYLGKLIVID
jgi:uncharacterized repeat protein (TIGR01451 family)